MKAPALILAILLTALPAAADDAGAGIARKALDAALAGDHATFSSMATDTVNAALSKEALASIGATLEFQFGKYAGVTGVEPSTKDAYRIYTFRLDYERSIAIFQRIVKVIAKYPGTVPVALELPRKDGGSRRMVTSFRARPSVDLQAAVMAEVGPGVVDVALPAGTAS